MYTAYTLCRLGIRPVQVVYLVYKIWCIHWTILFSMMRRAYAELFKTIRWSISELWPLNQTFCCFFQFTTWKSSSQTLLNRNQWKSVWLFFTVSFLKTSSPLKLLNRIKWKLTWLFFSIPCTKIVWIFDPSKSMAAITINRPYGSDNRFLQISETSVCMGRFWKAFMEYYIFITNYW